MNRQVLFIQVSGDGANEADGKLVASLRLRHRSRDSGRASGCLGLG